MRLATCLLLAGFAALFTPAHAAGGMFREPPPPDPLGSKVRRASHIFVVRVAFVDQPRRVVLLARTDDLKVAQVKMMRWVELGMNAT